MPRIAERTPAFLPAPRRGALVASGLALVLAACGGTDAPAGTPQAGAEHRPAAAPPLVPAPWDLAIHGARVVDGSGEAAFEGGLLVADGRIVNVGPLDPDTLAAELEGAEVVDAMGRVLAPGYIDAHAHGHPLETPGFPTFLAQGVTTIVLGMDGGSPTSADLPGVMRGTDALGPWTNVAWLAGHGSLRQESPLGFGAPNAAGIEALAALVRRAMDAGAFGLSTGLEYDAGRPANADELARVGEEVAQRDGIISSHMRSEDADQVEASLEELLEQGRRSGARVHASHLKVVLGDDPELPGRVLGLMDDMRTWGGTGGCFASSMLSVFDGSVDGSVRIEGEGRVGLERLVRYCARGPLALERLHGPGDLEALTSPEARLVHRPPEPEVHGRHELRLARLEPLDRLARLVPPPRIHRHRYHGVRAPDAPLRAKVVWMGRPRPDDTPAGSESLSTDHASQPRAPPDPSDEPSSTGPAAPRPPPFRLLPRLISAPPGQTPRSALSSLVSDPA